MYLRLLVLLVQGVLHAGLLCTADPVTYLDSQSCRYSCTAVSLYSGSIFAFELLAWQLAVRVATVS
jgi:hypothetical protein